MTALNKFETEYIQLISSSIVHYLNISLNSAINETIELFAQQQFNRMVQDVDFKGISQSPLIEQPELLFQAYKIFENENQETILDFQQSLYDLGVKNGSRSQLFNFLLKQCLSSIFYNYWWDDKQKDYLITPKDLSPINGLLIPYSPQSDYLYYLHHFYFVHHKLSPPPSYHRVTENQLWEFAMEFLTMKGDVIEYRPPYSKGIETFTKQGDSLKLDILFIYQHHLKTSYLSPPELMLIAELKKTGLPHFKASAQDMETLLQSLKETLPTFHEIPIDPVIIEEALNSTPLPVVRNKKRDE